jgi:tetratricopeptide (TPR) repeat protein
LESRGPDLSTGRIQSGCALPECEPPRHGQNLGKKAITEKEYAKAAEYLTRALQNGADFAATYVDLGEALARLGRVGESAKVLEQGVAAWPFSADIQKSLILRYVTLKQFPQADEALKRYVSIFPQDTYMRGILARVEALKP